MSITDDTHGLARTFRAESGRILASLMMLTRDIDLAEDALHDALVQASHEWQEKGTPNNPAGWLLTTARRRLIDHIRKEKHRSAEATLQAIVDTQPTNKEVEHDTFKDERLRLIFVCSHPALAEDVRVPLTLKTLCGLSTREIARAYLSSEVAMNQRLTRAKRKIRDAGIAYEVPEGDALYERLASVLAVIYLMYNESYSAFEGQTLTRSDLAQEAIRLARLLKTLLPLPDVDGLLALLLLHDSRRAARSSDTDAFIPLERQDRKCWDHGLIKEGTQLALTSLAKGKPGVYQVQAAISALHAMAPSWRETDWSQIQQLYGVLSSIAPSPIVSLNHAMVYAYLDDLETAYKQVCDLEVALKNYQPFYVSRAELEYRRGNLKKAMEDYQKALRLTKNEAEKTFLITKKNDIQKEIDSLGQ